MPKKDTTSMVSQPSSDSAERLPVSICRSLTLQSLAEHLRSLPTVHHHAQLVGHPSPMLRSLDHDTAIAYIAGVAFKDCTARFNIPVEKMHCITWAEDLLEDHPDLRAVEIRRIIKHMSKRQLYNRIDVSTLHTATDRYMAERSEAMALEREKRHQQQKSLPVINTSGAPDWFKQRTRELEEQRSADIAARIRANDAARAAFRAEQQRLIEELKMNNE